MKPLHELLKEGDPLASEPTLDDADARVMRRVVVAAADQAAASGGAWRYAAAMAVMAAVMLGVIATLAQRDAPPVDRSQTFAGLPPVEMQFSTPGGTRVIWVFDQSESE